MAGSKRNRKEDDIYEYYDKDFTRQFLKHGAPYLDRAYFRSRMIGFEELPERINDAPIIYTSNHSGMAFPWDGMVLGKRMLDRVHGDFSLSFRPLSSPLLSMSNLMNPYMISEFWKKVGCVDAYFDNFGKLMKDSSSNILMYPEGVPGIGKGFNKKYKLQRFSSSFVYNCLKYKTKIVPVLCVNGEYINPYSYNIKWVSFLFSKIGIPFLPLGIMTIMFVLQPWVFYMGFPARLTYIRFPEITYKDLGEGNPDEMSLAELREIADKLRDRFQEHMNEAVTQYGKKPYDWKNFWQAFKIGWKDFPYNTPFGWPILFSEFHHQFKQYKNSGKIINLKFKFFSFLKILMRDPILIAFYIPVLGWIPLLIKGYHKNKL